MAQEEGFEPPTNRLTADCSTTELLLKRTQLNNKKPLSLSILNLMRLFCRVLIYFVGFVSISRSVVYAKPEALAALFQSPKPLSIHGKAKRVQLPKIPGEYGIYFKAKAMLERPSSAQALEAVEKEILLSRLSADSHVLEKELDEFFNGLEIKRGTKLLQKKSWDKGLQALKRGLFGLSSFKWVYYWDANDSKQLSATCNRNKKKPDEVCLLLAKKIVDTFPKAALETKTLRDLTFPEASPAVTAEVPGERLSQTYTEKKEKDEEDFQPVLGYYLAGKDIDLLKSAKEFMATYPKSILRFRAMFLMAESLNRTGGKNEAQEYYQTIINEVPLSFYSIVSAERLGLNLSDQVKTAPIMVDSDLFNPTLHEKDTLERAKALFANRDYEEAGIELDTLSRTRNYSTDFLLYLARFSYDANQNLVSFKFFNELIQRKYDHFLSLDLINIIFPDRYLKEIEEQATLDHLDPLLVISLMKQESGFRYFVLSSSGAIGLMQLMSFTALETESDLTLKSLKDPATNIRVGTKYLGSLIDKYQGNIPFALSAYNAGPTRVAKWKKELKPNAGMIDYIESIPFHETREYVMSILRNRYWYQFRKGVTNKTVFDVWKDAMPADSPSH